MLAQLHDAYRAMLIEDARTTRRRAAQTLLGITSRHALTLTNQVKRSGQTDDTDRLKSVMQNGTQLAHRILTSVDFPTTGHHITPM